MKNKFVLAILMVSSVALAAEPAFQNEVSLPRDVSTPFTMAVELTQNAYNYVSREEDYTVQVPYEVEEPYEEEGTYYESEESCGYETRESCSSETQCSTSHNYERVCHTENRCRDTPRGEVCFDFDACELVDNPSESCSSVPSCSTESYYDCDTVSVPHSRTVTRYRTVTYYRTEERTRTVVDAIYDHQWGVKALVVLPEDSTLEGNERESVVIKIAGNEAAPSIEVQVVSSIYGYRIAEQTRGEDGVITAKLALVAKYRPEELAEQTILNVKLEEEEPEKWFIRFEDRGTVARTTTKYRIQLADKDTSQWVFQTELDGPAGTRQFEVPVDASVVKENDHIIRLTVSREGRVIAAPVQFRKDTQVLGQLDPVP